MNRLRRFCLFAAALGALCLFSASAEAATKTSRGHDWKAFWKCERGPRLGLCFPLIYQWDAVVQVKYTSTYDKKRRGNVVTIQSVDQSTWMAEAANSPCNVRLGIQVEVLEDGKKRVATLHGTRWGSYIYHQRTLHYGRVSEPNLRVFNPVFRVSAAAASAKCTNSAFELSWVFTP